MSKTTTILATGYMQPGRLSNGMATARARILEADPKADVMVRSWKEHEDIPAVVLKIEKGWTKDSRLVFAGHSWGVWYLVKLAKSLGRIPVAAILSADGVNRPPRGTLRVPDNVAEVRSWYQTDGLIKGSAIATGVYTEHIVHECVDVIHPKVDEEDAFQDAVFELACGQS